MVERDRFRPFTGDAERRIRIDGPPLALVLCQVRWPELTALQEGLESAARRVGAKLVDYPLHEQGQEMAVTITPEGVVNSPGEQFHFWHSADRNWHVTMTKRSVSLFSTSYTSFADFQMRLLRLLRVIEGVISVPFVERMGIRYVNRITDADVLGKLDEIVEPAVLGMASLTPASDTVSLAGTMNQIVYNVAQDRLQVRCGFPAPQETVDPAIPLVNSLSWVLDLDASTVGPEDFQPKALVDTAGRLADIDYDFFKMIAKDEYTGSVEGKK